MADEKNLEELGAAGDTVEERRKAGGCYSEATLPFYKTYLLTLKEESLKEGGLEGYLLWHFTEALTKAGRSLAAERRYLSPRKKEGISIVKSSWKYRPQLPGQLWLHADMDGREKEVFAGEESKFHVEEYSPDYFFRVREIRDLAGEEEREIPWEFGKSGRVLKRNLERKVEEEY